MSDAAVPVPILFGIRILFFCVYHHTSTSCNMLLIAAVAQHFFAASDDSVCNPPVRYCIILMTVQIIEKGKSLFLGVFAMGLMGFSPAVRSCSESMTCIMKFCFLSVVSGLKAEENYGIMKPYPIKYRANTHLAQPCFVSDGFKIVDAAKSRRNEV